MPDPLFHFVSNLEGSHYIQGYLVVYTVGLCSNYAGPWPKHAMTEYFSGDLLATGLGNGSTMCARKAPKNSLFLLAYFLFMEMICQQFTLPGMPTVSTSWVCKRCINVAPRLFVLTPPQWNTLAHDREVAWSFDLSPMYFVCTSQTRARKREKCGPIETNISWKYMLCHLIIFFQACDRRTRTPSF